MIPATTRARRRVACIIMAVGAACLLALVILAAARHSWSPVLSAGSAVGAILGAYGYRRSTRSRT